MVTTTETTVPHMHAVRAGGRARSLWAVRVGVDLVSSAAVIALVWFGAQGLHDPAGGGLVLAAAAVVVLVGLSFVRRRVNWHIATHIPGGVRVQTAGEPPMVWTMTYRSAWPDLVVRAVEAVVVAAAGMYVVTQGPAPEAEQIVGFIGGMFLAVTILDIVRHLVRAARSQTRPLSDFRVRASFLALRIFVAAMWVQVGAGEAVLLGAEIAAIGYTLLILARWARR